MLQRFLVASEVTSCFLFSSAAVVGGGYGSGLCLGEGIVRESGRGRGSCNTGGAGICFNLGGGGFGSGAGFGSGGAGFGSVGGGSKSVVVGSGTILKTTTSSASAPRRV